MLVVHVCWVRLGDQMWVATLVLVDKRGGVDTTLATVSRCLETWVVQLCLPFKNTFRMLPMDVIRLFILMS